MYSRFIALCGLLALAGCVKTTAIECGDGLVCPEGTVCDVIGRTCVEPGGLVVQGDVLDLGSLQCGTSALAPITLSNFSTEPITFTASSTLDILTISPTEGAIAPGERLDVVVTADVTDASVALGTMEGAVYFTTATETVTRLVSATIEGGVVSSSASAINFGIASLVNDAEDEARTFELHNTGNLEVGYELGVVESSFQVTSPSGQIPANSSVSIEVDFEPQFTGDYSSELTMSFTGSICQPPPTSVSLSGTISDAPLLVSTTVLDYGTTDCGVPETSLDLTFTSNLAVAQRLSFELVGGDEQDYTVPGSVDLPAGDKATVSVQRNPIISASPGDRDAKVEVTAQPSGETLEFSLQHNIVAPRLQTGPQMISFPDVNAESSQAASLFVANIGNAPAAVSITPSRQALPEGGELSVIPSRFSLGANLSTTSEVALLVNDGGWEATTNLNIRAPGDCGMGPPIPVVINVNK